MPKLDEMCHRKKSSAKEVKEVKELNTDQLKLCATLGHIKKSTEVATKKSNDLVVAAKECDTKLKRLLEGKDRDLDPQINTPQIRQARACYRRVLVDAAAFSDLLRANAFVVAETHVGFADRDRMVRGIQVGYTNFAAEFGNQIASRADALLKQMRGEDRRVLSTSVYLRDASQTEFLNLFVWNHAGAPSLCEEGCQGLEAVTRDRVRVVERLWQDHNWEKINSVHASGQGEVRMVFIKDDIGNWNLKRFDNDPTELLDAYRQVGLAALRASAQIAQAATLGNLGNARQALALANEMAFGQSGGETLGAQARTLDTLRQRTSDKLSALQNQVGQREQALPGEIQTAEQTLPPMQKRQSDLEKERAELNGRRPKETAQQLQTQVDENRGRREEAQTLVEELDAEIAKLKSSRNSLASPDGDVQQAQLDSLISDLEVRQGTAQQRQDQADATQREAERKLAELADIDRQLTTNQEALTAVGQQIVPLQVQLGNLQAEQRQLKTDTLGQARAILDDYSALIDNFFALSPGTLSRSSTSDSPGGVPPLPKDLNPLNL